MHLGRYAALAALLMGGVCAALPFAKRSPAEQEADQTDAWPPARLSLPQIAVAAEDDAASPARLGEVAPASWHQPTPIAMDSPPLPSLPHAPVVRAAHDWASRIHEPDFTAAAVPAAPVRKAPPRKHRIADGDSLPLIALRYLGDQRRAEEIAALNRDVISDPALLPIGREIVIPDDENR